MALDREQCSKARLARDARFDGKFFIAVLSTGIYCRPTCHARTSKESNVRYYETAAAATHAGFRPCMRCRPECSPGAAAWAGTQNTVVRALRLIGESGLQDGGVERLCGRLGVGSRHLRRLFLRHLGATPKAVAQTRRLQFAKKLIDETQLPMSELAMAAGFGCVRRFHAAIARGYGRTPTQLRRLARRAEGSDENEYLFRLDYRPPYNWRRLLDFLTARTVAGMERTDGDRYARTIELNGKSGWIEIAPQPEKNFLSVRVQFGDSTQLFRIVERVRGMFDVDADWSAISKTFHADPVLRRSVPEDLGIRIPGSWDPFELTVRAILGQQVSVAAATAAAERLVQRFGPSCQGAQGLTRVFPSPQKLLQADLTGVGLTRAKAEAIRAFAEAVCGKQICFEGVLDMDEFRARLLAIPGIGRWTSEYVAMRALRDPDAFPSGDLELRQRLGNCTARELEQCSQAWRPWRAYAAMLVWQGGSVETPRIARKIA